MPVNAPPARGPYDTGMTASNELDVRVIEPRYKHPTIHSRLEALAAGETLQIVNDHDPRPLRFEIDHDRPGVFAWNYVESGPEVWRVDITRV
ncbi:MAG: DUF2249 domain-containing protein [Vulcanimicrobiaceae bacterium]